MLYQYFPSFPRNSAQIFYKKLLAKGTLINKVYNSSTNCLLIRRTLGGRKLWESKDDRKWGHDKFEEMTMQERHYEEGRRNSKGHYHARGKNRGADRGYGRGNRSKAYNNHNNSNNNNNVSSNNNSNSSSNQNQVPRSVRGEVLAGMNLLQGTKVRLQHKTNSKSGKSFEKASHSSSGRAFTPTSNVASDPIPTRKHVFASSLSSASPPFYPSGSSNKEISLTQKRDLHTGTTNRNIRPSVAEESFGTSQSGALPRGKNIVDSVGMDKLYIDDSLSPVAGKSLNNLQLPSSGSSLITTTQSPQVRAQGRGLAPSGQMNFQPTLSHNQLNRAAPPAQLHAVQRSPVQARVQPSLQSSSQQLGQRPGSGSQTSSPPKNALSINSLNTGTWILLQNQVMGATGNMGVGHGDQNFPGTPAFLPVMQFGGQHPGGIGVPAVGMAFPGYVANPQLGLGNSEMTW
ncbi:Protein MLN51-like [Vitis vinifera]|uniref:Protein MLN51-like n=1 Tax=Vitis vinifera TaxID=29760 RepID=A0A438HTW1_VITVI|nr:Protein MLN51-like [Vitis vinifera]